MERKKVNIEDIKGSKIDLLAKRKIESLDLYSPPISGWNRSNTWQVIKSKLEGANKTVIVWGFAVAASISLLVAASININTDAFFHQEPKMEQVLILENNNSSKINHLAEGTNKTARNESVLKNISIKYPDQRKTQSDFKSPVKIIKHVPTLTISRTANNTGKSIELNPFFSARYSDYSGISPTFGIDFKVFTLYKHHIRHDVILGGTVNFQKVTNENSSKIHPFTFLHVGYDRVNETTSKGWSTQAGFMVNPDSNVYKNNTVKFSLNRQFNSHIKAGPEVIFTDNFKKAYPGISIVLS
ncbi:hypothetical protein [Reichenbachiella sp. MALMAid0571]|uniref:hypothetical protein n=1 Tax=Reichenbachiella sp. MALMAid0571 TaxID=3143939 RepID=UPI0032DEAB6F